jgi:hypothetical protein
MSGAQVLIKTAVESSETIDLKGLAQGIYLLQIQSDEGLSTIKISKQ